jgi:hypothetical protein
VVVVGFIGHDALHQVRSENPNSFWNHERHETHEKAANAYVSSRRFFRVFRVFRGQHLLTMILLRMH